MYLLVDLDVDVHSEGEDKIIWYIDFEGTFSVRSLCVRLLRANRLNFPTKAIWKSKAPTKACFLA